MCYCVHFYCSIHTIPCNEEVFRLAQKRMTFLLWSHVFRMVQWDVPQKPRLPPWRKFSLSGRGERSKSPKWPWMSGGRGGLKRKTCPWYSSVGRVKFASHTLYNVWKQNYYSLWCLEQTVDVWFVGEACFFSLHFSNNLCISSQRLDMWFKPKTGHVYNLYYVWRPCDMIEIPCKMHPGRIIIQK